MAREYEFFVLKQYPKERQFVILKEMEKGVLRHNREDAWQKGVARNDPMIIKTQYSGSPLIK